MSAKAENFIVVSIGDTDGYGYDERTLPVLLGLLDCYDADHSSFTRTGIVMYFRTRRKNLAAVERLVADAESLREKDHRFVDLKIGIAEGELVGEFDWLGRVKKDGLGLVGETIVEAVRGETKPGDYRMKLSMIAEHLNAKTA